MLKVEVIFILNEFNDLFSGPFLKKVADFFKIGSVCQMVQKRLIIN